MVLIAFRINLASSLSTLGIAQRRDSRASEAVTSFRRAITITERLSSPQPVLLYNVACYRALLAGVAGVAGSGLTAAQGRDEADRAMDALRGAVAAGFRLLAHMRVDTDLDALRDRADFQLLLMDLAMPADPFARTR
jgi:hypothetical protein